MNAISAGPVKTLAAAGISGFSSILGVYRDRAALRRNIDTAEVADAAVFLLGPARPRHHGRSAHGRRRLQHHGDVRSQRLTAVRHRRPPPRRPHAFRPHACLDRRNAARVVWCPSSAWRTSRDPTRTRAGQAPVLRGLRAGPPRRRSPPARTPPSSTPGPSSSAKAKRPPRSTPSSGDAWPSPASRRTKVP